MSDATTTAVGDSPCILIVGDSRSADDAMDALAGTFAERSLLRARTAADARERLTERDVHCLVCPFDPDERSDSPSLLERLADRTDAPIVALADGDDADRALEAGASDVVSDASATVLRTRVRNAADRERYRRAASAAAPRHRAVLESADAVVWVVDAEGAVEYTTPAVESRLGYTPAELERTALTRLVHPDDREAVREAVATAAAGPTGTTERASVRLGHADGTWRVATLSCTNRLADPALEGVVVTRTGAEPPTDADGSDPVRTGLDRLADPVFVLGADDDVQYANAAASRFVRRFDSTTADEPLPAGTVLWDRLPDALSRSLSERVREAERTGSVTAVETTVPSLEEPVAVAVHPGDDGVTIHVRDRAADAVRTERDRLALLESVVDAVDVGIAVLEGSTIRLANPALLELADTESLVGRDLESVFDDDLAAAVLKRADSPVVRWLEPVSGTLATEPPRSVDVSVAPLSSGTDRDASTAARTLCVVRDGRRSRTSAVSMLRRTTEVLASAETPSAVRTAVVDAVGEWVGADVAVWYRGTDDDLRPAATVTADHTGSDDASIEPPAIDPRGTRLESIREAGEPTVDDREAFPDTLARTGLRAERVLAVPVGSDGVVLATSAEPTAFDGVDVDALAALSTVAALALEDRDRAAALRTCRHERNRLETVVDRDERLWALGRSLLAAETREAVETRLCEGVASLPLPAATDGVALAWVGRVDDGRERIVPVAWAGRDAAFLESATVALDGSEGTPTHAAATTREAVVIDDLATDDTMDAETTDHAGEDSWRRRLRDRGFRSALSVPLTADEFRFGALTAYATRPGPFDERTRRACTHLGAIAGAAIGAIETKAALLADRVTELEVVCRDETEPLSSLAGRLERPIDVRAVILRSTDGSTVYCSVSGDDSDAIRSRVAAASTVESVAIAGDADDRTTLEIVFAAPTVAGTVAAHGGVLRSLEPVDDRTRLTIELGEPVDVRAFVRALERRHPGTELIARRTRERPPRAAGAIDDLAERLSERQQRTLEAAYHGGFFEWPRDHTGEEIAATLGISQPTFSRHLRLAQRKLFALLFDDADEE
ncbi:histidine kinase [Natrinema saccharevitans]|uniref:Histidine kinase n=1 Tax=Natrinema saccharevitans TaxID=301967 RepID=A0A1S8AUP3_9EURY|nr:bacterio-opsin activator domain-containing protein [Natrinema saccharevitans]OLZ40392.1 histidine kinase [Natrinema saccharevitans]